MINPPCPRITDWKAVYKKANSLYFSTFLYIPSRENNSIFTGISGIIEGRYLPSISTGNKLWEYMENAI
jgi:hypothetical protein